MTLRTEIIEAIRDGIIDTRNAEAALDAFLDRLEGYIDRWGYKHLEPPDIRDLIVTLREEPKDEKSD